MLPQFLLDLGYPKCHIMAEALKVGWIDITDNEEEVVSCGDCLKHEWMLDVREENTWTKPSDGCFGRPVSVWAVKYKSQSLFRHKDSPHWVNKPQGWKPPRLKLDSNPYFSAPLPLP